VAPLQVAGVMNRTCILTKARKYVDWEMASTLPNDANNKRSGMVEIVLPSAGSSPVAPPRLDDNLPPKDGEGYARWYWYPTSKASLRSWIDDAFSARSAKARYDLIDNTRALFKNNPTCP